MRRPVQIALALCLALVGAPGCVDDTLGGDNGPCAGIVGLSCEVPMARLEPSTPTLNFTNREGVARKRTLTLRNVGDAPLTVFTAQILAADEATFSLRDSGAASQRLELDTVLDPGDSLGLEITYDAVRFGDDTGAVVIHSDDRSRPQLTVTLLTVDEVVRITASPKPVDFGDVSVGNTTFSLIFVENRGAFEARITSLTVLGDPGFSADDPSPRVLLPTEDLKVSVRYSPRHDELAEGTVVITYVSEAFPEHEFSLEVALLANWSPLVSVCPVAVALGIIVADGLGEPIDDPLGLRPSLEVERGATVRLDATRSSDPDGDAITGTAWRVAQVPPDFSLDFTDPDSAVTEVRLLQAGTYIFELEVTDARDVVSCNLDRVTIEVLP